MLEPNPTNPAPAAPASATPASAAPAAAAPAATPGATRAVKDVGGVEKQVSESVLLDLATEKYGLLAGGYEISQRKAAERGRKEAHESLYADLQAGKETEATKRIRALVGPAPAPAAPAVGSPKLQAIIDDPEFLAEAETNPGAAKAREGLVEANRIIGQMAQRYEQSLQKLDEKLQSLGSGDTGDDVAQFREAQSFYAEAQNVMAVPNGASLISFVGSGDVNKGLAMLKNEWADYVEHTEDAKPKGFFDFVSAKWEGNFKSKFAGETPNPAPKPGGPQPIPSSPGAAAPGAGGPGAAEPVDVSKMTDAEYEDHYARSMGRQPRPSDLLGRGSGRR